MEKKFYLSTKNKKKAGVCGGLAEYFGLDATLVRIIFVLFTLAGGSGVLAYLVIWLVAPKALDTGVPPATPPPPQA